MNTSENYFPPPTGIRAPIPSVNPRTKLAPLRSPPSSVVPELPKLSGPASALRECSTHAVTTHILEAAFPRCISTPGRVVWPEKFETKSSRKQWVKEKATEMITEKMAIEEDLVARKTENSSDRMIGSVGLWNTVLRVARKNEVERGERIGVTLVTTHPIGFHKETWEAVFLHLIELTETTTSPIRIEELWSLECVNHGDSALINGLNIPKLSDRSDYARDLANFCINHLPIRTPLPRKLPDHLPRLDTDTTALRIKDGFGKEGRILIGVGHSLGGDATALCALSYPNIFSSIILSETTLFPPTRNSFERSLSIVASTLGRREAWPSRKDAREAFLRMPLFQPLHPAVLESYITHALYDDEENACVRLKCKPEWEASEFAERLSMNEGWEMLPRLDEKVGLHWIMGGLDSASNLVGGTEIAQQTVWRRPRNTTNVRIPGAGHLVVQEKPLEFAVEVVKFLNEKYDGVVRSVKGTIQQSRL